VISENGNSIQIFDLELESFLWIFFFLKIDGFHNKKEGKSFVKTFPQRFHKNFQNPPNHFEKSFRIFFLEISEFS